MTKLISIGKTVNGQDILAVKVTKDAQRTPDGRRPAVLYLSAQHAREWITPEMTRRLLRQFVADYATNAEVKKIVDTTELWFVPVANPDGYDYTFTNDRLWRKNLRDNDGDGVVTGNDGVDPNRNWPTKWGYDNEGSSPSLPSQTYRGASPASEPETQAMDAFFKARKFKYIVNYHSAAQLLLYGVGWQVSTPTPDDLLFESLLGDDKNPAVPGYDPDLNAELYTTNGETTEHAHTLYGAMGITPEMSTCQTASAIDPNDAFDPAKCLSVFNFPDDEKLIQDEFAKNVPLAKAIAKSAQDPENPVSVVGRTAPDMQVDSFSVSTGTPQTVAVTAKRSLRNLRLNYSVNAGPARPARVREWGGGERYGADGNTYYAEYRGVIRDGKPGDSIKVWFTALRGSSEVTSESFTYTVKSDTGNPVLVLANEDYEGVNPTYPAGTNAPKYAAQYVADLKEAGYPADVWDVSKDGVPHDLGVLGHYRGIVWYLGENRLTQDPEDEILSFFGNRFRNGIVAERQQYLTMAVRDYLNAGGKLIHSGETAAYYGATAPLGGIYYGLNGAPDKKCVVTIDSRTDCLILSDDFTQYYLGAFNRSPVQNPQTFSGIESPLPGVGATFGGIGLQANPLNEAGSFTITSDSLPEDQFPQFRSWASGVYSGASGAGPFSPVQGSWYVGTLHADDSYTRLTRTVDLSAASAADNPTLKFQISYDTEESYDNVLVEARTAGGSDWTTLPVPGLTDSEVPAECEAGFLLGEHPSLANYLTPATATAGCKAGGATGDWNRMTGNSGGWKTAQVDLSKYAGKQVEVTISYVTDPGSGGVGVFVDDTSLVIGGTTTSEGFETGLGDWAVQGAPAGSPRTTANFVRSQALVAASVSTSDTLLLGFGLEQIADPAERATLLNRSIGTLLGD